MLGALCLAGCGDEGERLTLSLRVHSLASCDLPSELADSNLELAALGDFEADNDAAEALPLGRAGTSLRFPAATQAVVARVQSGGRAFVGYGERRGDAGVDVLLWPERATCALPSAGYPGKHGGQALGYAPQAGVVLVAGGNDPLNADALLGFLTFDARSGALAVHGRPESGAQPAARAFASVTRFGSQLLVAGGEKPVLGVPDLDLEPCALGELFDTSRGFTGETIALQSARTHHAAVNLDDGRTLLVGGRTKVGSTSIAQYQLEIVDPRGPRSAIGDAVTARIDPTALNLDDGRVFVAGGTALDGSLVTPVGEWLTAAGRLDSTRLGGEVAPRFERAFVALSGGGVLAVGGCEDRPPASDDDAERCARCLHGCEPLDGYDAWWIDRDGNPSPVRLDGIAAPRPLLLPGSDGSPWLIATEMNRPETTQLFRFNPWARGFEAAPLSRPHSLPSRDMPAPLSLGLDTFMWLEPGAHGDQLIGLRLGTRSRYAQDLALVLLADPLDPTRPLHLTPERAPGEGALYDGKLTLRDSDVIVRVADTDYADVTIDIELSDPSSAPPVVWLGSSPLGGAECPWPEGDTLEAPSIVRRDGQALLRFHGGEPRRCPVGVERLTLGLAAGAETSVVSQLRVRRSAR